MNQKNPIQGENLIVPLEIDLDEIISKAKTQSNNAPKALKECVFTYYIARYMSAYFDTHVSPRKLPGQVWNEYRNALDHFMRHVTSQPSFDYTEETQSKSTDNSQLKAMKGHAQRAALDSMKLVIDLIIKKSAQIEKDHPKAVLLNVFDDDETFYDKNKLLRSSVRANHYEASTFDSNLGEKNSDNVEVLKLFLNASASAATLLKFINRKLPEISNRNSEYIASQDSFYVIKKGINRLESSSKKSLIINIIIAAVALSIGILVDKNDIFSLFNSLSSYFTKN